MNTDKLSEGCLSRGIKHVNAHVFERWRYRSGIDRKLSDEEILRKVCISIDKSTEVQLKPQYRATALLNHGLKPARYFQYGNFVFVVEGFELKTVHCNESKRWIVK